MAAKYYGNGLGWDRRLIYDLFQKQGFLRRIPDESTVQSSRDYKVNPQPGNKKWE